MVETTPISRNQLHNYALEVVYAALTYQKAGLEFDLKDLTAGILKMPYPQVDLFLRRVTTKALVNQQAYIEKITPHLRSWKFERLARCAQAILLIALAHYFDTETVDKAIVINNAVRLAKRYLNDGDYKFINGVLEQVLVDE
ncbi:MAG: transcription antitermination protein NusB [Bacilli bacterium]|jgi:N utilization substance protein B